MCESLKLKKLAKKERTLMWVLLLLLSLATAKNLFTPLTDGGVPLGLTQVIVQKKEKFSFLISCFCLLLLDSLYHELLFSLHHEVTLCLQRGWGSTDRSARLPGDQYDGYA